MYFSRSINLRLKQATNMRIIPFLIVFVAILSSGCEKLGLGEESPARRIALSIDSTTASPGDLVTIRLDAPVTGKNITVMVKDVPSKAFASGDSAYSFLVPVVASGNARVRLPDLKGSDTLQLTIRGVAAVSDPGKVLNDFAAMRDRCMDSLMKQVPGADFLPSAQTQTLFKQLKDEWDYQLSLLTPAEKEILAYHVRGRTADPSQFSFTPKPTGYYGQPELLQDIGDELIQQAKSYVFATNAAVASVWATVFFGGALLKWPSPYTAILFAASLSSYIIMRELAARRGAEVGRLNGIPEAISESDAQQPAAIPEFQVGTEKTISMKIHFRNLRMGDQSLSPDLSKAFQEESVFESADNRLKSTFDSATIHLKNLKVGYDAYVAKLGRMPVGKLIMNVPGSEIIVKGLNTGLIEYATRLDGNDRKIKITRSNLLNDGNFNILLAYKRKLDGKEFNATMPAIFKIIRYRMSGLWRLNFYTDDSRTTLSQSDLINFGAAELYGSGVSYTSYPSGTTYPSSYQWMQQFRPDTYKLNLTLPYNWPNILYQFDCDGTPGIARMIGQSIGASNRGYNMELVRQ
jgi:hypothetical protein